MSLVLKKALRLPYDDYLLAVIYEDVAEHNVEPELDYEGHHCVAHWVRKGTTLPDGPLHPIAALAFGMAGFVLKSGNPSEHLSYAYINGEWRKGWLGGNGLWVFEVPAVLPPKDPTIVGHQDSEVL